MSSRVLVTGSVAYDVLLGCDGSFPDGIDPATLDHLSVGYLAQRYVRHHGGTGANIAWHLALLGSDPLLVATVGADGGPYRALLRERGIDDAYIEQREDALTSTAFIATDASERQITFFHPGADAHGRWPDLSDERDACGYAIIGPRDAVLMRRAADWCAAVGLPYFFDPGQQITAFGREELLHLCRGAHGVIVNTYEWDALLRLLGDAAASLASSAVVLVTRGEDGVEIRTASGTETVPACRVDAVVNPTGAGDAFRAGLLHALVRNFSLRDAVRLGAALASFVVETEGTLLDTIDRDAVQQRARRAYGAELPLAA